MAKKLNEKLEIIVEFETMHRTKYDSITAPIFFKCGDRYFPEKGWSDFVVVILLWWKNALSEILKENRQKVEFDFMDGPYKVDVILGEDNTLQLLFQINEQADNDDFTVSLSIFELNKILNDTASSVLHFCDISKWENSDIRDLRKG